MNHDRYEIRPKIWLDARRAVWFEEENALAVADLHLGYAWAHRVLGQLLPLEVPDDTLDRLSELQRVYRPSQIVLLGDIVHRAVDVPWLHRELNRIQGNLAPCQVRFVAGNHDGELAALLGKSCPDIFLERQVRIGPHLLIHGHDTRGQECESTPVTAKLGQRTLGLVVMGHEHPALLLGDGVATSAKCPCFLISPGTLILPAFSSWASGTVIRPG